MRTVTIGLISVIVRVRDEAAALDHCLGLIRSQTVPGEEPVELIVVDTESADGSAAVAERHGARVVPISLDAFSFGRALNRGAAAATGEVLVSLSAHAFPLDEEWLGRVAAAFSDPTVACACGERLTPEGKALRAAVRYDAGVAARWPAWGYANAAGAFRRSLWQRRGFREDLPGCEDKEWGRWAVSEGYVCLLDPALIVDHDHTHDPVLSMYQRARREAEGYAMFLPPADVPAPGSVGELVASWWNDTQFYDSRVRARLSHRRAASLLGAWRGRAAGTLKPA